MSAAVRRSRSALQFVVEALLVAMVLARAAGALEVQPARTGISRARSLDARDARSSGASRWSSSPNGSAALIDYFAHSRHSKTSSQIFKQLHDPTTIAIFAVFAVVFAPFAEETIFRVFFFNLGLRYGGFWGGAVLSGVLFGIAHGDFYAALPLALGGIVLCAVYYRTRNAFASMISHALFNALLDRRCCWSSPQAYASNRSRRLDDGSARDRVRVEILEAVLERGRLGRRRRPAVESAIAHVAPDEMDGVGIRLVVPVGMVREPEPDGRNAAARQREVQRAGRNADEEIDASRERFVETRERLVEVAEERAKSCDALAEIFVVHRDEAPRPPIRARIAATNARASEPSPQFLRAAVTPRREITPTRVPAARTREPFVDEPCCAASGAAKSIAFSQRLREIERREPLGAHQQPREVARFGVKRIRRAAFGLGIIGPEHDRRGESAARRRRAAAEARVWTSRPLHRRSASRDAARRDSRRRSARERR